MSEWEVITLLKPILIWPIDSLNNKFVYIYITISLYGYV